ncbi:UDP-glucose dehydrogenase family protein [Sphingobium nicotianae]|uniref:UDP-glucose 6-dehydrogenase n=1 Tax=Sphingobium nicotianae TaxID=2782607 RepID=A0A9X1ITC5_9SPHN|nr:UDP-glucose/GDP-mannose dehydrogenase family protein [Sphingobium nicotianae]MBT2189089.1 UDP-glucose/GDP-mannose dehydrogenase family protein [Sphingobium nicotianae]
MKIAMIGTGYVGLVTGAGFSEFGHSVVCVDKDANKIAMLIDGIMPIFEPGLNSIVAANTKAGRLSFTADLNAAVPGADAIFIAVGTPSRRDDGHADLTDVLDTAAEIARALTGYTVIVTKSTVPVGTSRKIEEIIRSIRPELEFDVVSNPEFLREGSAIGDFRHPDRVVVGCDSERAREVLREIYRPHHHVTETPVIFTTRETSELIKYASNAFLATKITFINEMADICEKVGGDVKDVARGMGLDRRIGRDFLNAGPGYGGSCFPKDTLALLKTSQDVGAPSHIVETVVAINAARKIAMAKRIEADFGGVNGKTVAVLGLTFKPDTDDMRDAPSLVIVPYLQSRGARIQAYDPRGGKEAHERLNLDICKTAEEALSDADGVVILTEWKEFQAFDLTIMKRLLMRPLVVDLRNIYSPEQMAAAGFAYFSIGRPSR